MTEIVNRIKESGLISLDLATYRPKQTIVEIDIAEVLWKGLVLKEKDFRAWVKDHHWEAYKEKAIYVHCSVDAIVPTWAFMLIGSKLHDFTKDYIIGNKNALEKQLIKQNIEKGDLERYRDARIIIKGCSDVVDPEFAMVELVRFLQPVAKSIMYGEPCSTVPVFKRLKN